MATGLVVPLETMRAPFSGEEVVGFRLKLTALSGPHTYPFGEATRVLPFELDDGSGRALIDGASWLVLLPPELPREHDVSELLTPERMQLLEREGMPTQSLVYSARYGSSERLLRPGQRVLVAGVVEHRQLPGRGTGYRDAGWRPVFTAPPGGEVLVSAYDQAELRERPELLGDLPEELFWK